ncbi:hypothetical protein ACXN5S_18520 [Pseudoroseicyclus sp. H15]
MIYLIILAAIALIVFAYLGPIFMPGDFDPPAQEMNMPVDIGR